MNINDIQCAHACRNTCAKLSDALHKEAELAHFYETLVGECDYPEINSFLREFSEEHRAFVTRLMGKLNEMKARSQMLDGIMASFDPAGC